MTAEYLVERTRSGQFYPWQLYGLEGWCVGLHGTTLARCGGGDTARRLAFHISNLLNEASRPRIHNSKCRLDTDHEGGCTWPEESTEIHEQSYRHGVSLIASERDRQIRSEGWDAAHDDAHDDDTLLAAALCYATEALAESSECIPPSEWPFDAEWWKPGTRARMLVKAGALIAAQLDYDERAKYKEHVLTLSPGEWDAFIAILENPPAPSDILIAAMRRHGYTVRSK